LLSQIRNGIVLACERIEENDKEWAANKRFSFESLFIKDCIERGLDIVDGGSRYQHMNHHLVGIATAANSLFAIKELVFTRNELDLSEVRNILKSNFDNRELLRLRLANKLEKFGNDLDGVDSIAVDLCKSFISIIDEINSSHRYARTCYPEFYSLWWHRDFGKVTGASFDGRKAGESLSENQSPVYGTDTTGPTALLNSLEKIPFERTPGGGVNIKLDKSLFKDERDIFECLLKGYLSGRGLQMQVDLLSNDELVDAMKNPEKHKDLLVRIVGYSAYFVTLSPDQQMEIINRTDGRI
jgi:formate C-acetyltransferase